MNSYCFISSCLLPQLTKSFQKILLTFDFLREFATLVLLVCGDFVITLWAVDSYVPVAIQFLYDDDLRVISRLFLAFLSI